MANRDTSMFTLETAQQRYAELEAELVDAVADFGLEELEQMVDAAEAIRRVRRL